MTKNISHDNTNAFDWKHEAPQTAEESCRFLEQAFEARLCTKVQAKCSRIGVYVDESDTSASPLFYCNTDYFNKETHITLYNSYVEKMRMQPSASRRY